MQETIYVGLDLGSSRCQQTMMNGEGLVRFSGFDERAAFEIGVLWARR